MAKSLLLLLIQILAIPSFALQKSGKLLNTYEIKLEKNESLIISQASQYQMAVLVSAKGKTLIIAKENIPQSINSVKIRAQEDGVRLQSIRKLKWQDRTLFYYETPDFFHVYSTRGGHLLISRKISSNFDFKRILLTPRIQNNKKVVKL